MNHSIPSFAEMKRVMSCLIYVMCLMGSVSASSSDLNMMADIREPITTEFGEYVPQPVEVEPSVTPYAIANDFSNVGNMGLFQFSEEQKELLRKNGFLAARSEFKEMYEIYRYAEERNLPIFVTVDALWHAFHEQFDLILRTVETEKFRSDLLSCIQKLYEVSSIQAEQATEPGIQDAARRNAAYFAVAARLLNMEITLPEGIDAWVNAEMQLIQAHAEMTDSPLFEYVEDYTQYIPRGHYTLSEELTTYFQAMMWLGRMTFHNRENESLGITFDIVQRETTQALLITQLMNTEAIGEQTLLEIWQGIYQPTRFLVGQSDDLTCLDYATAARAVYGENFEILSIDTFSDSSKLAEFLAYPQRPASLISETIWGSGFRWMGQRFVPDSAIFLELYSMGGMPSGLDIMAVFGSERAKEILTQNGVYHEGYDKLRQKFASLNENEWVQSVYWNWLYSLMPMLANKGEGFPFYMRNVAWQEKELACALGAWAELRHDTILYAKQAYASGVPEGNQSYTSESVETNPWAFARLLSLTTFLQQGLEKFGLYTGDLDRLIPLVELLKLIAEKELAERPLTIAERTTIRTIWTPLALLSVNDGMNSNHPGDLIEDDMAVIADVYTDIILQQCLEVAVGHPLTLFVAIGSGDQLHIAVGSAFSYYEFAQPIEERLTDSTWQTWLNKDTAPSQPEWLASYLQTPEAVPISASKSENGFIGGSSTLDFSSKKIHAGDPLEIRVTFVGYNPNYVYSKIEDLTLHAEIDLGSRLVDVVMSPDISTEEPYDYAVVVNTQDWLQGEYGVTIYFPGHIGILNQEWIQVEERGSGVESWWEIQ